MGEDITSFGLKIGIGVMRNRNVSQLFRADSTRRKNRLDGLTREAWVVLEPPAETFFRNGRNQLAIQDQRRR